MKIEQPLLTEIKRGQTGTGLLHEHDGHIKNNCDSVLQLREDLTKGQKFFCPDHLIVDAVFQKYGIKNANDRIYPENVLRPEVDNYIANRVRTNCAFGALDHPNCQLEDTKILTENGWKDIADVQVGDKVLTVNHKKQIEVHPVLRKIDQPYKGTLIHIKGNGVDLRVTPEHKFPVLNKNKKYKNLYTAKELLTKSVPLQSHCSLFRNGEWTGQSEDVFIVKALTQEELQHMTVRILKARSGKDVSVPMNVWMRFLGLYIGGGDFKLKFSGSSSSITIVVYDENAAADIKSLMDEMPFRCSVHSFRRGFVKFTIHDVRLAKCLAELGSHEDRHIPSYVFKQTKENIRLFFDGFRMADSARRGTGNARFQIHDFITPSKQLALDLTALMLHLGYSGRFHEADVEVSQKTSTKMFGAYMMASPTISLGGNNVEITEEQYEGRVYCIEVENHTFYTMDSEGNCLWSGNSSSLSGHDVAMIIRELHWEGQTLLGKLEIHTSPGYRQHGICSTSGDLVANMILSDYLIGVSSRGVGTVKQMPGGLVVVEDDFQLICWDVVLEPSTPGAYIGTTRQELQQYVENRQNPEYADKLFIEKRNRIDRLLKG